MNKKPVLVIMAAGMGSRYGGLKQIDPVDEQGHIIMDFSIFDARRAGFEKVIFIIKRENEEIFREAVGNRISRYMETAYAFQELSDLPEGFSVPQGRQKPWGTGHAVLSCRDLLDGPFAVINADDYYGEHAFKTLYTALSEEAENEKPRYTMIGYVLENTLTENGHVARGVCRTDGEGLLTEIQERTHIEKRGNKAVFTEDGGRTFEEIPSDSLVSMNMWGFPLSFIKELEERFPLFLEKNLGSNPMKCEYFLPAVVSSLIEEGKASVKVERSGDKWYGVTYKEDKPQVMEAIRSLKACGRYPEKLWE
ncbi:MAG TPA: nucleotidyltransferase [Candidatus Choladousia intestinigallinarum]|nr:nucleotidyltransferase [Candidatus Choladousia intestinigallinarum]